MEFNIYLTRMIKQYIYKKKAWKLDNSIGIEFCSVLKPYSFQKAEQEMITETLFSTTKHVLLF